MPGYLNTFDDLVRHARAVLKSYSMNEDCWEDDDQARYDAMQEFIGSAGPLMSDQIG